MTQIDERILRLFSEQAEAVKVTNLVIGIGYTAVQTSDGGIGLSYTYFKDKTSCYITENYVNYEGQPASLLLSRLTSPNSIERSMSLALVNALNYRSADRMPEDKSNLKMLEMLGYSKKMNVAMVGYIKPLEKILQENHSGIMIIDDFQNIGNKTDFYSKLKNWADLLILTSTSISNNTLEAIIAETSPDIKSAILGPGTPMAPPLFDGFPIHYLGGTVPVDKDAVLRYIRHGMGTRQIHKSSKKVYITISPVLLNH
ncbi:MAG: DUF364 domain-containing protein [Calditrichaceae bacterium]|nr:DUF364 domain-containing protein [Calditrichaceae bacterium]MBN2707685.1 DUF364 domain-containing protein [Calditrichaceae bacterium]RQV96501.1 MAG: hypothetical protein EH224_04590 [Calditrichota bacterium]